MTILSGRGARTSHLSGQSILSRLSESQIIIIMKCGIRPRQISPSTPIPGMLILKGLWHQLHPILSQEGLSQSEQLRMNLQLKSQTGQDMPWIDLVPVNYLGVSDRNIQTKTDVHF